MSRPIASLSLDLDNKWSYLKTHGDAWEHFPSYLDVVVPRVLQFLKERDLSITFFIVGQDAALAPNHAVLRSIAEAGHEIGNHSFHHEPWLHLYSEKEVETELALAEESIAAATGVRPMGFRGPGFSVSPTVLRVLARRGYRYDASTFPTFLGPLARAYYFAKAKLPPEEKAKRKLLFGKFREGFRPLKPYRWATEPPLVEIPVTTMPWLKVPIHVSYVLYLACFSRIAALAYFRTVMLMCRAAGVQPSMLLHPLDFLGGDDVSELAFFPAMSLPAERKLSLCADLFDIFMRCFRPVTMEQHAEACSGRRTIRVL